MMKKRSNNTTMILVAILSFLCGVMLIGAYSLHLRHQEEAKVQAQIDAEEAEKTRQAELAKAQEEENARKQNSSETGEDGTAAVPSIDVDKALGSDLSHIDLSSYVQNLSGLLNQLDATEVSGSDGTAYETADHAIRITKKDETMHQVEIISETTYSLYHVFIGMLQTDATTYLQSKGYKLSNRDGQTCYRIDDYKLLYLKFDGTRVVDILLEVTEQGQPTDVEE